MQLFHYLQARGISQEAFGASLTPKVSQKTISSYICARYPIPLPVMVAIESLTGGAVTPNDWRDNWVQKHKARRVRRSRARPQRSRR